ncbi:hypothetical protein RAC92_09070 [Agrobacterium sp. CR_3]
MPAPSGDRQRRQFRAFRFGGCVEAAVITEALEVIGTGKAKMLEFCVADETARRVGLSCGGRIRIHVERLG